MEREGGRKSIQHIVLMESESFIFLSGYGTINFFLCRCFAPFFLVIIWSICFLWKDKFFLMRGFVIGDLCFFFLFLFLVWEKVHVWFEGQGVMGQVIYF